MKHSASKNEFGEWLFRGFVIAKIDDEDGRLVCWNIFSKDDSLRAIESADSLREAKEMVSIMIDRDGE